MTLLSSAQQTILKGLELNRVISAFGIHDNTARSLARLGYVEAYGWVETELEGGPNESLPEGKTPTGRRVEEMRKWTPENCRKMRWVAYVKKVREYDGPPPPPKKLTLKQKVAQLEAEVAKLKADHNEV